VLLCAIVKHRATQQHKRNQSMFTSIAFVTTAVIAFAAGVAVGVYFTCKSIASGKVKNVKVVG